MHKAASNKFSTKSPNKPFIKLPRSPSKSLKRHDTKSPTPFNSFLTLSSRSGFGILSLSRLSCMSLLVSDITTPLILAVSPLSFFVILLAVLLIALSISTTSPVILSTNSSISFFSTPLANFMNSAIGPLSFVELSDPHLPFATITDTFKDSLASSPASDSFIKF